jgi:hypothetical protein
MKGLIALTVLLLGVFFISSVVSAKTPWREEIERKLEISKKEKWDSGVLQEYPLESGSFCLFFEIQAYPHPVKAYSSLDISPETKIFIDNRKAKVEDLNTIFGKNVMCFVRYEEHITKDEIRRIGIFDNCRITYTNWKEISRIRYTLDVYIYVDGGGIFFLPLGS